MDATHTKKDWGKYDFLGIAKYITVASFILTAASLIIISTKGLIYGVDFVGGIETQVQFNKPVDAHKVREFMTKVGYHDASVQALGENNEFLIRIESPKGANEDETNNLTVQAVEKIKSGLNETFSAEAPVIRRTDTVGPQVGAELRRNGILAAFYCLLLILIYVGLRFDYRYAPGAVFCLFHDAIMTVGIYSLMGWEFNVQTMAGILTIMGYSLNDTIVIFDRIRENQHAYRERDLYWVSNLSINETLSRTILTYIMTYLVVGSMFFFADGVIHDFARSMTIGMLLGAYSTVYVATPLMLVADHFQKRRKQQMLTA